MAVPYLPGVGFLTKGRVMQNFVITGIDPDNGENYIVEIRCPFCGKQSFLSLPRNGLTAYQQGAFVQNAFPGLNADDREQIMTGICPACWDDMFKDDE